MIIDEKFARYILSLQSIVKLERGLNENYDIPFRDKLEKAFPNLNKERETEEFENWLWTDKIFNLPEIKILESTINQFKDILVENYKIPLWKEDKVIEKEFSKQERRIKKLNAKKEKYYNLFSDDPKIRKEYKLLKTISKLSS